MGILTAELYFPENCSLKDKRMHLRRIRDQLTRQHGASFAEVGHQDLWQRSRVVIALAASDGKTLDGRADRVKKYLDSQDWVVGWSDWQVVDVDA